MADNAWASVMRANKAAFFYAVPNLVLQSAIVSSSLQYVSSKGGQQGYVESRNVKKKTGPKNCCNESSSKHAVQTQKCSWPRSTWTQTNSQTELEADAPKCGSKRGLKKAGGTSTAKEVRKKELGMQRHFEKHGVNPISPLTFVMLGYRKNPKNGL